MVKMANKYTGGLFQLLLVEMSWGKNSRETPMIESKFCLLIQFIKHPPPTPQFVKGVWVNNNIRVEFGLIYIVTIKYEFLDQLGSIWVKLGQS